MGSAAGPSLGYTTQQTFVVLEVSISGKRDCLEFMESPTGKISVKLCVVLEPSLAICNGTICLLTKQLLACIVGVGRDGAPAVRQ